MQGARWGAARAAAACFIAGLAADVDRPRATGEDQSSGGGGGGEHVGVEEGCMDLDRGECILPSSADPDASLRIQATPQLRAPCHMHLLRLGMGTPPSGPFFVAVHTAPTSAHSLRHRDERTVPAAKAAPSSRSCAGRPSRPRFTALAATCNHTAVFVFRSVQSTADGLCAAPRPTHREAAVHARASVDVRVYS